MDRLSIVIALAVLAAGCNSKESSSGSSRSRSDSVKAQPAEKGDPAAMCDKLFTAAEAPTYTEPETVGAKASEQAGGWRWINIWATWCKPCVEELPRLRAWRDRLHAAKVSFELRLISADESDADIAAFHDKLERKEIIPSARLTDPDRLKPWLGELGLKDATLPVHLFVDPAGKVRCLRASEVSDADYRAVAALLGAP